MLPKAKCFLEVSSCEVAMKLLETPSLDLSTESMGDNLFKENRINQTDAVVHMGSYWA